MFNVDKEAVTTLLKLPLLPEESPSRFHTFVEGRAFEYRASGIRAIMTREGPKEKSKYILRMDGALGNQQELERGFLFALGVPDSRIQGNGLSLTSLQWDFSRVERFLLYMQRNPKP